MNERDFSGAVINGGRWSWPVRTGKDSATNLKPSIKICHKYQILKGLAGTDDFNGHVIHTRFQDWRDFADEHPDLRRTEIGQDPRGQKVCHGLDQVEVAAPAKLHDQGRDLGVVQGILERVTLGGPADIRHYFDVDQEPLLHRPLLRSHTDSG